MRCLVNRGKPVHYPSTALIRVLAVLPRRIADGLSDHPIRQFLWRMPASSGVSFCDLGARIVRVQLWRCPVQQLRCPVQKLVC